MTQNLIRKLLSLVSKNLPKKLRKALKKKKKVCMHVCPEFGGKKKFHLLPFLISYLRSEWGWGEGWERLAMMEPKGSGCARVWYLEDFPFHHVVGRL